MANCKTCGAPLKVDAEICEYCGALTEYGEKMHAERQKTEKIFAERKPAQEAPNLEMQKIIAEKPLQKMPQMYLILTLVIYVITLGYYAPFWYCSRSFALKKLYTNEKSISPVSFVFALACVLFLVVPINTDKSSKYSEAMLIIWLCSIALMVLYSIILAFKTRQILRKHAAIYIGQERAEKEIAPSVLMTFLFGVLYLQYSINEMISMKLLEPKI